MLSLTVTEIQGEFRIELDGELDIETAPELDKAFDKIPPCPRRVVIDCARLAFLDSSGVGALLRGAQKLHTGAVPMEVTNLEPDIEEALDVLGFFEVLEASGIADRWDQR